MTKILRAVFLAFALVSTPAFAQVGKTVEAPAPAARDATYVTSPVLRDRAIAALFKAMGGERPVSKLEIRDDQILMWVQGNEAAYHTDEWVASRMKILVLDRDSVSGPRATDGDGIVKKREGSFFRLDDVALDRIEAVIAEAVALAQMERQPEIDTITIARRLSILPEPAYGEVQMTLNLSTERETATVYADGAGNVLGADLAGTARAERLDMIADDDWPMADAQRRIAEVLGTKRVHELRIYNSYVFFQAEHATRDNMTRDYSWDLGGVTMGLEMEDHFAEMRDTSPFTMAEIDLGKLPEIKRAALAAFESEGAKITYIDADKPTDRPGEPELIWAVDLKQADGEEGKVLLDANAKVLEVILPESRIAASSEPWLAPVTVAQTLKRLETAFGPDAKYGEILLNDTQGSVLVEDPQAPGSMASFIIDRQSVTRFGTPMPWEAELNPTRTFTIAELAGLDEAEIGTFADRTLTRMDLPGAAVFRYTFTRNALMMNPEDSRLLVEVRAGKDDGWTGGWVTFDLDGNEADVMLP